MSLAVFPFVDALDLIALEIRATFNHRGTA